MRISDEIRRAEKLSKEEAEDLERMYEEIEEANPSMPPSIYQPDATIRVDARNGGSDIDASVLGTGQGLSQLRKLVAKLDSCSSAKSCKKIKQEIYDLIGEYTEAREADDIEEVSISEGGWIAHLTMPGYIDQTEPQHYKTLKEAIEDLHNMFVD
jgi:hypothetical protein